MIYVNIVFNQTTHTKQTTNQRSEQDNEISDDVFLVKICLEFFIFIQISEGSIPPGEGGMKSMYLPFFKAILSY